MMEVNARKSLTGRVQAGSRSLTPGAGAHHLY